MAATGPVPGAASEAPMTLLDLFAASAGRVPDHPAIVFRERRLTYRELERQAHTLSGVLRRAGLRVGDRAVLVCPNLPEFGIGYLGVLMAGAAVVPLNPLLKEDEVRYVLEDSGATALVCLQASLPVLHAARAACRGGCPSWCSMPRPTASPAIAPCWGRRRNRSALTCPRSGRRTWRSVSTPRGPPGDPRARCFRTAI